MRELGGLQIDDSPEARKACSRDAWPRARKLEQAGLDPPVCAGVVRPKSAEEVASVLRDAALRRLPVLPVGLRSGIVGGLSCRGDEVAVDLSGLDRIVSIDEKSLVVRVEGGVRGSALERALERRGLTIGHYPQSLDVSSVGGWIATRASGIASTSYGSIEQRVLGMRVALADGTLVETPSWPRASVGPDLTHLFVGSEGTLGVICDATLAVKRTPSTRRLAAWAFPSFESGLEAVRLSIQDGIRPAVARLYNSAEAARFTSTNLGALLITAHEGVEEAVAVEASLMGVRCTHNQGRPLDEDVARIWWQGRYDAAALLGYSQGPGSVADAIDFVADWSTIGPLVSRLEAELRPVATTVHVHASHFYETGASAYVVVFLDADGPLEAIHLYDRAWAVAMRLCLEAGAGIAHHHGIGAVRLPWIGDALGSAFELLVRVRRGLDPEGLLGRDRLAPRPIGGPSPSVERLT
jgi:alkyldihydroxyacetonephosphate synthase